MVGMAKQTALQCVDACLTNDHLRLQAAATGMLSRCLSCLLPPAAPIASPPTTRCNPPGELHACPARSRRRPSRKPSSQSPAPPGTLEPAADSCTCNLSGHLIGVGDPSQAASQLQQHFLGDIALDAEGLSGHLEEAGDGLDRAQYLPLFCRVACHCMLLAEAGSEAAMHPASSFDAGATDVQAAGRPERGRRAAGSHQQQPSQAVSAFGTPSIDVP